MNARTTFSEVFPPPFNAEGGSVYGISHGQRVRIATVATGKFTNEGRAMMAADIANACNAYDTLRSDNERILRNSHGHWALQLLYANNQVDTLRAQNAQLSAQRDELVKALQDARKCCSDMYGAYHVGTPYHKRMVMQDRLANTDAVLGKMAKESQS